MDFSKFRTCDWLLVAGGAVMLVFGQALDWASSGGISGNSPFTYFFTGGIAYLLVVASGIVAFLLAGRVITAGTTPWPIILLGATGLATLLMLLRLVLGADTDGVELDREAGMFVAFIAAAVALVGAVINFTSSGGSLKDLTDVERLKRTFSRPDDAGMPPPSSPSGSAPPPPPPPPVGGTVPPPPPPP